MSEVWKSCTYSSQMRLLGETPYISLPYSRVWGETDHNVHSRVIQTYLMGNVFSSDEQDRGGQRPVSQPHVCSVQDRIPGQHSAQGQWVQYLHYHCQICKSSWWWCFQPGGGNVKIENRKLEWSAQARTKMVNENYTPGGGDKKVNTTWYFCPLHQIFLPTDWKSQAELERSVQDQVSGQPHPQTRRRGQEDREQEARVERGLQVSCDWWRPGHVTTALTSDWSRVGSTKNLRHQAGGGNVRIHNEKLEFKVSCDWWRQVTWPQYSPLIGCRCSPGSGRWPTWSIAPAAATRRSSTTRSTPDRWAVIGGDPVTTVLTSDWSRWASRAPSAGPAPAASPGPWWALTTRSVNQNLDLSSSFIVFYHPFLQSPCIISIYNQNFLLMICLYLQLVSLIFILHPWV